MLLLFPQSFSFLAQFLDESSECYTTIRIYPTFIFYPTTAILAIRLNRFRPHPILGFLLGKLGGSFCLY